MKRRPLTIMQVLPALNAGGVERGTLEIAEEAVRRGHRSIVVSSGGRMVDQLIRAGSEHVAMPVGEKSMRILGVIRPLRRLLRQRRPDILHVRSRLPAWTAHFALRGMDETERPIILSTVHGLYSVGRYSRIMTQADRVIAVSTTVERYLRENYPSLDPQRICVIPRGVCAEEFPHGYEPAESWRNAFFSEYPSFRGRSIVTLPGRLSRGKGHTDFLDLLSELRTRGTDAGGLIVGGEKPRRGAYARRLRTIAAERGLDITLTGHRTDVREIYAFSSIVLSLSRKPEAFGRTVLEALSLGTPVVGYDHGGVGEILAALFPEGRVPVGDIGALADAVERCLRERPHPPPQTTFLKRTMLDRTIALYEELAHARSCEAQAPSNPGP